MNNSGAATAAPFDRRVTRIAPVMRGRGPWQETKRNVVERCIGWLRKKQRHKPMLAVSQDNFLGVC